MMKIAKRAGLWACLGMAGVMAFGGAASAQTVTQTIGPDIIVCSFPDVSNNTPYTLNTIVYDSFCVGTTSANRGNATVNWWQSPDNRHPAISQNLFRYAPSTGRFEQLAQGSLKHGFTALQQNDCASPNYFAFGCTSTAGTTLGIGCSDPYCCGLNNGNSNGLGGMGPKWEVNAATGLFNSPYSTTYQANSGPPRVRLSELNASPSGSRYFMEGQYIVGDDAAFGNKFNNATWQEVTMSSTGTPPAATNFAIALTGAPHREQPGIYAWQTIDPTVTIAIFDVPNDGRFLLGCKVTGPVSGLYTYEYALQNLNSHRCAGSVIVPLPGTQAALTNIGFHDVETVAEPNATPANPAADDWTVSGGGAAAANVSWAGPSYSGTPPVYNMAASPAYRVASFVPGTGNDHTANVLRWGSMFNFRFTSEVAPASTGSIAVGMFRPGTGTSFVFNNVPTPGGATVGTLTATCCTAGNCTVVTQAVCGAGTWGLPGTTCSPDPCVLGACCDTGVCSVTVLGGCNTQWTQGGICNPNPCPAPTGACCANSICNVTTQAACASGYQGNNTTCVSGPCPPPNDSCANAIWIADGVPITATNTNAATDFAGGGLTNCGTGTNSSVDVWYKYKPVTTGNVRVTTNTVNGVGSTGFDTVVSVHAACGTGVTILGCNDDSGSPGNSSNIPAVALTAGTTYLIRVAGYNSVAGTFTLTVIGGGGVIPPTGPANDNCAAATAATVGANAFTTVGATTDGPTHTTCNFNASNQITNDVWFTHTGTANGGLKIDTCTGAGFDTKIAVYSGSGCASYDTRLMACNDDGTCAAGRSTVSIPVTAGQPYVIRVGSAAGATGAGTLSLTLCRADFDGSGQLSVQDIFDFLNAWFSGSARSDFNLIDNLSVQDIFDFLNSWFAGC